MLKKLFRSRKFTTAIAGAIFVVLNDGLGWGIGEEAINQMLTMLGIWIGGEALTDAVGSLKPKK